MLGTYCTYSDCKNSKDCKRFMIVDKELDSFINFKAICSDSPRKPYEYWIEMDKEVVVKEETQETEKEIITEEATEESIQSDI